MRDLDVCTYFPVRCDALIAVGWLARHIPFETGEVDTAFFERLRKLCASPWQPFVSAGLHSCELCQFDPPCFTANVFIPHGGRIYVSPVGIIHYIASHWYKPPQAFIQAVEACPDMNSMEYKKALLSNGGRSLVKAISA